MPPSPIIGHARQLTELASDIETNNIAHAYLFAGAPHLGKRTVARWFSREVICSGKTDEEKKEIDHQLEHLLHPDLLVLDQLWIEDVCEDYDVIARSTNVPQQHRSKAPTMKTDTISIDDVRQLQARLQESGSGQYRFCLIRSLERMQPAAATSLLKILEEPPEGRIFLLTTQSLSSLLPTITSRARVLRFERVRDPAVAALLTELPEEEAQFIVHLAQGAPGTAKRLLSDPDRLREERLLHEKALSFWSTTSLLDRLKILTPLHERGKESDRFLLHLALALREMPAMSHRQERALMELLEGLKTNAHRQLLVQSFALQIGES